MSFLKLAEERFSVRSFDDKPVEDEKIDLILKAAQYAPTACNYQAQRIYVLKSQESREKMKQASPCTFNAPLIILVCADTSVAWSSPTETFNSAEMDGSIVATHIMLEAWELGIGSTWVRLIDSAKITQLFNLPPNIKPVCILPMGYPSEKSKPSKFHYNKKPYSTFVTDL